MRNSEYDIKLNENAKPFSIAAPRRIPLPLRPKVEQLLHELTGQGIISEVKIPTPWCAGLVVVPKKNGDIRMCVDYTQLNKYVERERLLLPSVDETLALISDAKIFSRLDAASGFWQVPLSPKSALLTTFLTPFGRFCFNRLPFGISSAPEFFHREMSHIVSGIPGTVCHMDDIVVFGKTKEEHDSPLKQVLTALSNNGVKLNREKCIFGVNEIKFLGCIINRDGIKSDPDKVKAIVEFKEPENVPELRRFLGMVNHLCKFVPHLANITQPLRVLLRKDVDFIWDESQKSAFKEIKDKLSNAPILALYNPNCEMRLSADSSSSGLGAYIEQFENNQWKPIAFASRSLNVTERRFAQIEKEALAITWACERFRQYILGKHIIIKTDHKPLISILNQKCLDELTPKIQRMRMKLMEYSFTVQHTSGKEFYVPDTLSRTPDLLAINDVESILKNEVMEEIFVFETIIKQIFPATDARIEQIKKAQNTESEMVHLKKYVMEGWPTSKEKLNPVCYPYWQVRHKLSVYNDLIVFENRIVIPPSLRREILQRIHQGHQGMSKCRRRACESVYWPGITQHIKDIVTNCPNCIENRTNHSEPLMTTELPNKPWEFIGLDLAKLKDKNYLIIMDYYSKYPEVFTIKNISSNEVISKCKAAFGRHGIPRLVMCDNGRQLIGKEFKDFASKYGFSFVTRSPEYPQSNGLAEAAVKIVKKLLLKSEDPNLALLSYRNTPLYDNGLSPAQLLMSRRLRDTLPILEEKLKPTVESKSYRNWHKESRIKQAKNFNKRHRATPLEVLKPEERVWITDRKEYGTVIEPSTEPRSYKVRTEQGDVRRNRKSLIPASKSDSTTDGKNCSRDEENGKDKTITTDHYRKSTDVENTKSIPNPLPRRSNRMVKPIQRLNL